MLLGIAEVPCEVKEGLSELEELEVLLLENQYREKTREQAIREGMLWDQVEREKARTRQGTRTDIKENFPESPSGQSRDKVAERIGMSGKSYEAGTKVIQAIDDLRDQGREEDANLIRHAMEKSVSGTLSAIKDGIFDQMEASEKEAILTGEEALFKVRGKVEQRIRNEERKQLRQDRYENWAAKPIEEQIQEKIQVIYADPPWRYDFSNTSSREIENHYPTMSIDEICEMEVPADDNALLLLWATAPKLQEALRVIEAWGFQYKTHAIWDKDKIGMGYWFRGQHELLLVATRGTFSPPESNKRVSSVLKFPRGQHSRKPVEIYDYIDDWFPYYSKLEMFARIEREGWISWGNQVSNGSSSIHEVA